MDLGNFVTDKVENMEEAFSACKKLKFLDIRQFSSNKLENKKDMFKDIAENGTIYFNSKIFEVELFNNTNIENWDKHDLSKIL